MNGFMLQAGLAALMAAAFTILMIRNIRCRKNSCGLDKKCESEDKDAKYKS